MDYPGSPFEPTTGPPLGVGDRRSSVVPRVAASLLLALAVGAGAFMWATNQMLGHAESVASAWAQVESSYQRRADLVPRLVESVNRYVRHEQELLSEVTRQRGVASAVSGEALGALTDLERAQRERSAARGVAGAAAPADAAALEAIDRSEADVSRGVRVVLAVAESYPALRSADHFLELQAQLEGTENRIHVARMAYNDAVRAYNAARVQLPTRWVAEARGFERRAYFRADEGAEMAGALPFE